MMNTVLNSREEALNWGKLINLDDEALDAGLPLDLAITLSAHKHCLDLPPTAATHHSYRLPLGADAENQRQHAAANRQADITRSFF